MITNQSHAVLYTGVTNNLVRRVYEHKEGLAEGFTKKYQCKYLVYYETFEDAYNAIAREKQIKAGSRAKKNSLVAQMNPEWADLYASIV
jgi:putative endonuclease